MKRNEDFRKALGEPDEYFRQSVIDTLDQLNIQAEKKSRPQRRYTTRIIASFAAVVLLVAGIILNRQYIPGISPDGHVDTINPTPTVATQVTKSSSVVETDLATLSIRNAGIDENTVYVSVEVMPRKKKSLALNWSIKPYSDSVTTIGKTPDYEGQTVMGWAREHDYEELIRVVFSNAFEPLTPGVVDASLGQQTGPVPDPAFDSICINHSEYEDNGATVIYVSGNSLPDTKEYMLGFVLQVWDMTLKDHEIHDSAFSIDTQQIFGNIPFSIGEPEEPEVIAEYKPVLNPENTSTTLVLLKTSYSDFYEIRTNIASYVQEYTGTSIFEYDNGLPSPISVSITTGTEIKTEEGNGTYIFRRACDINDVPEKLSLFLKSGETQEFVKTSSSGHDWGKEYEQALIINTLPESNTVETDFAAVKLLKADTDGYGVFLSFEVKPKNEKTLIVDTSVDPYTESPSKIGLTPDRSGQTILEWAVEHGFEELLDVEIFSSSNVYNPTYDASFHSYPGTPEQDGSVILDVYGSALPNTELYYLCCRTTPWDMNEKNIYTDTPNGRSIEHALLWDQDTYTFMKIPVSGEKETPEIFAAYRSDTDAQGSAFTASLFRTSMAEYCETWTNNPDYTDNWYSFLYTVPSGNSVFPKVSSIPMHTCIRQEDGSVLFRDTVVLPEEYPDTISAEFYGFQGQVDPPVTMKKTALTPDVLLIEEYSAQAWAITAEGYTDLLNNMDTRIGQVYVIKGFIQEVLSDNPLRVLMNTGEDGASQPVIVECPAYRNFTWEPGTFYRIYADASSIENEIPVLTAQYSYTESKGNTVETDLATLTFREAVRDGDDIRITVQLQPKNEKCIATSMVDNLTDSCGPVAEYYGIETERSNKTLYGWMVDHGYQENLAIMIDSLEAEENGNYRGTFRTEKCQIMDDGSSLLTIAGPAADDNIYNLMWLFVPRNMEEKGQPLLWDSRDSGTLRLEVTDTQELSATIIAPYMVPWAESDLSALVSTGSNDVPQMNNPAVADTDYATLKVREAKTDGYGVFLQVEVQSKAENTLVVPNRLDIRNDSVMKLGIDENKSIYQWAVDNHYQLLIVDFNPPTDAVDSDTGLDRGFHPYWATPSFIEENGSTVIKAVGYAIPDTVQYELGFSLYSVDQASSDILRYNLLETGVIPVTVSETEEPKVIAEYKATSSSCVDIPTPDATLTLLQSSCSDYCELRSGDTEHISSDSVYFSFMLSNDFFADGEFVEWGEPVSVFMLSHPAIEEDHTFVLRLFWTFPQEIPDKFRLSAWSDYYSGLYEKVR